jgi:dTDP-D-glucose 4,6-dehydratase
MLLLSIWFFHKGVNHETYNIGGFNEWQNIDLVKLLCQIMDEKLGRNSGVSEQLISYVKTVQDMIYAMLLMPIKSTKN